MKGSPVRKRQCDIGILKLDLNSRYHCYYYYYYYYYSCYYCC